MAINIIGADIGTSNIKMYSKENETIINCKNVIAVKDKKIFSFGDDAFDMVGKAPENIDVSFPVKYGVIADNENMQSLFYEFCSMVTGRRKPQPTAFYITVPTTVTEVEKRAFYELVVNAKVKAKQVYVIDKPIADGIGAGIDVTNAKGVMIINIGADTTEASVLSLGGIVLSKCVRVAGNKFDEAIIAMVKKVYNIYIGNKTAEIIKCSIGSAIRYRERKVRIYGRDVVTGLPVPCDISSDMVYEAMHDSICSLIDSIKVILERTPPELSADIMDTGMFISGGSSNIAGLCDLIAKETGLKVNSIEKPSESIVRGIIEIIKNPKKYDGLAKIPREKVYY